MRRLALDWWRAHEPPAPQVTDERWALATFLWSDLLFLSCDHQQILSQVLARFLSIVAVRRIAPERNGGIVEPDKGSERLINVLAARPAMSSTLARDDHAKSLSQLTRFRRHHVTARVPATSPTDLPPTPWVAVPREIDVLLLVLLGVSFQPLIDSLPSALC